MKKLLLLLLLLLLPVVAMAQSGQRWNTAIAPQGAGNNFAQIIPSAKVYVCVYNPQLACTTPLAIYSDPGLTTIVPQPLVASGTGVYSYFIQANSRLVEKVCQPYGVCSFNDIFIGGAGGGGGSGCTPSGTAGVFLYDSGSSGCSEGFIDWNHSIANMLTAAATNITLCTVQGSIPVDPTEGTCNPDTNTNNINIISGQNINLIPAAGTNATGLYFNVSTSAEIGFATQGTWSASSTGNMSLTGGQVSLSSTTDTDMAIGGNLNIAAAGFSLSTGAGDGINMSPYSASSTPLSACSSSLAGNLALVSDASALTPGTAYSVSAGAGTNTVHVECTYTGSVYAWQTM